MGQNGGKRAGAGRKPGVPQGPKATTLSKEAAREIARQMITAKLEPLIDAQVANAQGIKYLVGREKKTGKFTRLTQVQVEAVLSGADDTYAYLEVWEKDPSVQAFTDLLNRALDKPKEQEQAISITGELTLVSARLIHARKRLALKSKENGTLPPAE